MQWQRKEPMLLMHCPFLQRLGSTLHSSISAGRRDLSMQRSWQHSLCLPWVEAFSPSSGHGQHAGQPPRRVHTQRLPFDGAACSIQCAQPSPLACPFLIPCRAIWDPGCRRGAATALARHWQRMSQGEVLLCAHAREGARQHGHHGLADALWGAVPSVWPCLPCYPARVSYTRPSPSS